MTDEREFCGQCYGRGFVRIEGRIVECINCIMRRLDRTERERKLVPPVEDRFDRPAYDEQTASHLRMPGGSLVASFDRGFCGAAGRALLDLYDSPSDQEASPS